MLIPLYSDLNIASVILVSVVSSCIDFFMSMFLDFFPGLADMCLFKQFLDYLALVELIALIDLPRIPLIGDLSLRLRRIFESSWLRLND